jgi:hypothetical protein
MLWGNVGCRRAPKELNIRSFPQRLKQVQRKEGGESFPLSASVFFDASSADLCRSGAAAIERPAAPFRMKSGKPIERGSREPARSFAFGGV